MREHDPRQHLILPYGYADYGIKVATVPIDHVLAKMP